MELSAPNATGAPAIPRPAVALGFGPILGAIWLNGTAAVYLVFGLLAYPRQEWLLETLVAAFFLLAVVNLLRGGARVMPAVRLLGAALLLHSFWDALHWPGFSIVQTPVDPRVPQLCPVGDLLLGLWLVLRGR